MSASNDYTLRLWDLTRGQMLHTPQGRTVDAEVEEVDEGARIFYPNPYPYADESP